MPANTIRAVRAIARLIGLIAAAAACGPAMDLLQAHGAGTAHSFAVPFTVEG